MVRLIKAGREDARELFLLRKLAFQALLEKYRDEDTSPAAESFEDFLRWFANDSDCYFIRAGDENVGALRVVKQGEETCRVSTVSVLPEHRGKGYAGEAMLLAEKLYPKAKTWNLDTIKQEEPLLRFYERLGYRRTGREENLKDGMDLVYYEKHLKG